MTPLEHLDELERMARSLNDDCGGYPDASAAIAAAPPSAFAPANPTTKETR